MTGGPLTLRPSGDCRWDIVALGEVMLRFDPGDRRIRTARRFDVWEGGGEYNVARCLAKGFGQRAAIVTALPDNELGLLADDLIAQGGVDRRHILWRPGVGAASRVGLNFVERGFGLRPALGVSDRAGSAAAQIRPGEIDWDRLFGTEGARWLHTGGIFTALSSSTAEATIEAVEAARRHGVAVSFDLNYRASLWDSHPDPDALRRVNRRIVASADLVIGDAHAFDRCLGFAVGGLPPSHTPLDPEPFRHAAAALLDAYPGLALVATTLREVTTASRNDWGAAIMANGVLVQATSRRDLDIYDRIGGGDGFAAGAIYALLAGLDPQAAVDHGAALGALAMTTPGDTSMATLAEVQALLAGADARVRR